MDEAAGLDVEPRRSGVGVLGLYTWNDKHIFAFIMGFVWLGMVNFQRSINKLEKSAHELLPFWEGVTAELGHSDPSSATAEAEASPSP